MAMETSSRSATLCWRCAGTSDSPGCALDDAVDPGCTHCTRGGGRGPPAVAGDRARRRRRRRGEPLTDAMLLMRWGFGFRGQPLVDGAVDEPNCQRCSAERSRPISTASTADEPRAGARARAAGPRQAAVASHGSVGSPPSLTAVGSGAADRRPALRPRVGSGPGAPHLLPRHHARARAASASGSPAYPRCCGCSPTPRFRAATTWWPSSDSSAESRRRTACCGSWRRRRRR